MDRDELIATIRSRVADHAGIVAVYLFGSRGRGSERPASDVDLGVLFREPPLAALDGPAAELETGLEAALGLPVQVVAMNSAPLDLLHRILRDGAIVHDADPARRIRFEVAARNRYFDLLPHLARYRKAG